MSARPSGQSEAEAVDQVRHDTDNASREICHLYHVDALVYRFLRTTLHDRYYIASFVQMSSVGE